MYIYIQYVFTYSPFVYAKLRPINLICAQYAPYIGTRVITFTLQLALKNKTLIMFRSLLFKDVFMKRVRKIF